MPPGERLGFVDLEIHILPAINLPETSNDELGLVGQPHRPPHVEAVPQPRIGTITVETIVVALVVFLIPPTFGLVLATDFLQECRETSMARSSFVISITMLGLSVWAAHLSTAATRTSATIYANGLVGRVTLITPSPRSAGIRIITVSAITLALTTFCIGAVNVAMYAYTHDNP